MRPLLAAAVAAATLAPAPPSSPLAQEPAVAGVRVYYGPGVDFGGIDGKLISQARSSIDMAAYVLTDRALIGALGQAAMRGVRVRIYLDGEEAARSNAVVADIAATPNVELRRKGRSRDLMHLKSYQVDGRLLRTGSANFSVSGETYQDNDLLVIESPEAVQSFEKAFERMWARADNQRIGSR